MMNFSVRPILVSVFAALAGFLVLVGASCSRDKCSGVVCNGGSCSNGACICPKGYEGTNCQALSRTKFVGNWGAENLTASTTEPAQFSVSVSEAVGAINAVTIKNFHNYFTTAISAYVSGDSLVIPVQTVMGKTVSGSGIISSASVYSINNTITISYQVTDNTSHITDTESETWHG